MQTGTPFQKRILLFLLPVLFTAATGFSAPAQHASLQDWQDHFVDRLQQRLDSAEAQWPLRFSKVRSAEGYGEELGQTYFTLAVQDFRERIASIRGRKPEYWMIQNLFRTAWEVEAFESRYEVARLNQIIRDHVAGLREEWNQEVQRAREAYGYGTLEAEMAISAVRERLELQEEENLVRAQRRHAREGMRMAAVRKELVGRLKGLAQSSWLPCHAFLSKTIRGELDRFRLDTSGALVSERGHHTWLLCDAPWAPDGLILRRMLALEKPERVGFRPFLERNPLESIDPIPVAEEPPRTSRVLGLRLTERLAWTVPDSRWVPEPAMGPPVPVPMGTALGFEADLAEPVRGGTYTVEVRAGSDDRLLGTFVLQGGCDEPLARIQDPRPTLRRVPPSPPPLRNEVPAELVGTWEVRYEDGELGSVRGRACFSEEGDVRRLRLVDPVGGGSHLLELEGLGRDEKSGAWELSFAGDSPYASEAQPSRGPLSNRFFRTIDVPADEDAVVFVLGGARLRVALKGQERPPADLDRVTVRLVPSPGVPVLEGQWSYAADAGTHRARDGRGRVGSYDPATGRVAGPETWRRIESELLFVDVLSDQTGRTEPRSLGLPYPFTHHGESPRRFLAVYGEGLPRHRLDPYHLESGTPHVAYSVYAFPDDAERSPDARDWQQRAAESLESNGRLSPALRERLEGITPLIVKAELSPGVLPQFARFSIDGQAGAWPLLFGGLGGALDFVRPFDDRWEPVRSFYLPDELALELILTEPLPLEEIPVDLFEHYDADRSRPARIVGGTPGRLVLKRTDDPRVFRSARFQVTSQRRLDLAPPPRAGVVRLTLVDPEDSAGGVGGIEARLPEDFQVDRFLLPVAGEPVEIGGLERPGQDSDWKRAVREALTCRDDWWFRIRRLARSLPDSGSDLSVADWDRLARETQDRLLDLDINMTFAWPVTGEAPLVATDLQVGHYAAMILLRRELASQLRDARNRYRQLLQDSAALERYRLTLADQHITDAHPLSILGIRDPAGSPGDFSMLTWPPAWKDPHFLDTWRIDASAALAWHREQTKAVVERMVAALDASIATLEEPPCDSSDLLYSAAIGYGPASRALLPRLVRHRTDATGRTWWEPDRQARFWVESIPNLYRTVQLRRAEANLDTSFLNLQIAGAGLATAGSGSMLATGLARIDAGIALGTVVEDAEAYLEGQTRTTLARGAGAILGPGVYRSAEREARSLQAAIFNSMLSVGGLLLPRAVEFGVGRRVEAALPGGPPVNVATRPAAARPPEPASALPPSPAPEFAPNPFDGHPTSLVTFAEYSPNAVRPPPLTPRTVVPEGGDVRLSLPPDLSHPRQRITWTGPDGRIFDLQPLGKGGMANVYDVLAIDGRAVDRSLVLKTANASQWERAEQVMADIAHGSDLLRQRGTTHLEIEDVVLAGRSSYLLQQGAPEGARMYELTRQDIAALMRGEAPPNVNLSAADQRAAAELLDQMSTQNLCWADCHAENMYFTGEGADVQAGVLDPDMIFEPGNIPSERMAVTVDNQLYRIGDRRGTYVHGQFQQGISRQYLEIESARDFNEVAIQVKFWVRASADGVERAAGNPAFFREFGFPLGTDMAVPAMGR